MRRHWKRGSDFSGEVQLNEIEAVLHGVCRRRSACSIGHLSSGQEYGKHRDAQQNGAKSRSSHLQLGSRRLLEDNCLFSIMNGDSRTGVIARPFRIRDLAKKFFTFNDVKTYSFTVPRENTQDHIVLVNHHSQRTRLIMGHLDETAGLVCELAQLLEIKHTHTPRN